ncbi:helix-turn-helix domain-containing protein [Herbiconiux liangxiaofengii]|uniref:helix-turn-helix domain-containing protein n=1 Tax=Herbiconiux liangxiaofengii TaxID=3342795 RepID=UPI0035B71DAC
MNETRIGELRRSRGWTQERLSSESGVAVRTIQRIEAGKDASMETLALVAEALGVAVADLYVHIDTERFDTAVTALQLRREQQRSRDRVVHSISLVFRGVGLVVTLATIAFTVTGTWSWWAWFTIPIYWAGGQLVLEGLHRFILEPRLDAKYPLSVASPLRPGRSEPGSEDR